MSMTATRMTMVLAFLIVLLQDAMVVMAADAAVAVKQEIPKDDPSMVQVALSPKSRSSLDSSYYTKLQDQLTANYKLWISHINNDILGNSYKYIYQQHCHCPEAYTRPIQISVKINSTTPSLMQGQPHTKEIVTMAIYKDVKKETSTTTKTTTGPTDDSNGLRKRRRAAAASPLSIMPVKEDAILAPAEENESASMSPSSYPPSSMRIPTIQNLFDTVQESIDARAEVIRVLYDVKYGYPTSVDIDYSSMIADEETRLTATQLYMLVSQDQEPPEIPKAPLVEKDNNDDNDPVLMMATSETVTSSKTTTTTTSPLPEEVQDPTLSEFSMNGKINLYDLAMTLNTLLEEASQEGGSGDRLPTTTTILITPLALQEALQRAADETTTSLVEQLVSRNIQDTRLVQELQTSHFYQHYPTFDLDGSGKVDMYELTIGLIQKGISTSRSNIIRLHKILKDSPLAK